jgi:hypothetical protein
MGVFGDPDFCVERVQALRREFAIDEFIGYFNQGGIMDHALVKQSMTLFAKAVMPHCR